MTDLASEYQGETRQRQPWLAALLTFVCPGLGFMYVGKFVKGLTINLLFLLALEVFIILLSLLKFFPLLPLAVLVVGYVVVAGLLAAHVADIARAQGDDYVVKGYNHWMIYAVVFLLSYVAPIALSVDFTVDKLWSLAPVETAAMYPSLLPGDTVLVDLNAYRDRAPDRGDLVAVRAEEDELRVLRVVATEGDVVAMESNTLLVNDEPVGRSRLEEENIAKADLREDSGLLAWVEHNQGERYVISLSPRVYTEATRPIELAEDQLYLLSDNRSLVSLEQQAETTRDSRHFGPVERGAVAGVPRFIAWSSDPDTGETRWRRIGLRVR